VVVGPDLTYNGGMWDAFVAKVDADGETLAYCGYIGGEDFDTSEAIAVDAEGNAYVAGQTTTSEHRGFPLMIGPDLTYAGGAGYDGDGFVAKVNASGRTLAYCGYLGGIDRDHAQAIAVDATGSAYVTGWTRSDEESFPVAGGLDPTHNGSVDAFVVKVPSEFPASVACRMGTVDLGAGHVSSPVLTLNAGTGGTLHEIRVPFGGEITVFLEAPPAGPSPAPFALYAWKGEPDSMTVDPLPFGMGSMCMGTFLTGSSPLPVRVWNNIGKEAHLGVPTYPSEPAPTLVLHDPDGFERPITVTFQGLIRDDGAQASKPASITNAIVLKIP
jgi:hypothetical protein